MASKRDELKGKREKRYRLSAIPDLSRASRLGDLPQTARAERGEIPRPGPDERVSRYAPAQGVVNTGGGIGTDAPKPALSVTSVYEGRPLRATDFLVFMSISSSSPS